MHAFGVRAFSGTCLPGGTSGDTSGDALVADLTASSILGKHKTTRVTRVARALSVFFHNLGYIPLSRGLARRPTAPSGSANHVRHYWDRVRHNCPSGAVGWEAWWLRSLVRQPGSISLSQLRRAYTTICCRALIISSPMSRQPSAS